MKNISAMGAIRHPIHAHRLVRVLFFLGVVAFIRLPINLQPDISFPLVSVTISQPGARHRNGNADRAKSRRFDFEHRHVRNITTYIIEGSVDIALEFQIGTPIDRAVTDVRDAVAKVRNELPQGIMEPLVQRINMTAVPLPTTRDTTSLTPDRTQLVRRQQRHQAAAGGSGIAQVSRSGGVSREIRVESIPAVCRHWV